jgi:hypothetical protein
VWFLERDPNKAKEHMRLSNEVTPPRVRLVKPSAASGTAKIIEEVSTAELLQIPSGDTRASELN